MCIAVAALLAAALIVAPASLHAKSDTANRRRATLGALGKIRASWEHLLHTKQVDGILQCYAPDAVFLQPTGERIVGTAALRTLFQTITTTFNSDLSLQSHNVEYSGNLAYDSGDFQETLTNISTGAKINTHGSYIFFYKRQPNGDWLIVQNVWTGAPPPGT